MSKLVKTGAKFAARQVGIRYGIPTATIDSIEKVLFAKKASMASRNLLTPGKVLKTTQLGSYLDEKYEKKCGTEIKQLDSVPAPAVLPANLSDMGPAYYFNMGVPQGITDVTRIGNSIETKSLALKFTVTSNVLVGGGDTRCKIMLVRVTEPNGTAMAPQNIVQVVGNIRSPPQLDRSNTFKVIKEWDFTLSPQGDLGNRRDITFYHNPKGCEVTKWNQADVAGLLANNLKGLYQLFAQYEGGAAPTLTLYARFSYVDV